KRAALCAREYCFIDRRCPRLAAEDHAAARTAKRLVRRCRHKMRMRNRIRMKTSCNQARDMSHVSHTERANIIGNGSQFLEVNNARISAGSSYDQTRAVFESRFAHFIIIDKERIFLYAVSYKVIK